MKYFATLAASAALVAAVPNSNTGGCNILPSNIHGADKSALKPAPADLSKEHKDFLKKYQPLSDNTAEELGPVKGASFSNAGSCYAEYPCFTVERGAVANLGNKEEVTRQQVSAILDDLTSRKSIKVSPDNDPSTPLSVYQNTIKGATLQVIAPTGEVHADFLAGLVFDVFKLQAEDPATNAIRAVQARSDGHPRPILAVCLFPEGVDPKESYNFCIGNEPDGTPSKLNPEHERRQAPNNGAAMAGIPNPVDLVCGIIKLPIFC